MVSGLVTSPCDQLRIFSGDARLMRIASKSAIGFAMSKGLERYKVVLRFLRDLTRPLTALETKFSVPGSQLNRLEPSPCLRHREQMPQWLIFQKSLGKFRPQFPPQDETTENWELRTENCFPNPLPPAPRASSRP